MSKHNRETPSRAARILSDNLQTLRVKQGWTQAELGARIKIGQKQAGRVLNMETEITLSTLSIIAEGLGKPEALLLCDSMNPNELLLKRGIRTEVRHLIDELVRLDSEGRLTEQTLGFLTSALAVASPPLTKSDKTNMSDAK